MPRLVMLGTAAAVPDANHENTYMVLDGPHGAILIDCGGNPIGRLERAGVPPHALQAVIITHIHPDHSYGLPILLMNLWLLGRHTPLKVYAPASACASLKAIMMGFGWADWPDFYPVDVVPIFSSNQGALLDNEDFTIDAGPSDHFVDTTGVRVLSKSTGKSFTYTSDTAPTDGIRQLARKVDLLVHEAAGATPGHSSAAMAGRLARESGAGKLVLVHYQVYVDPAQLVAEARSEFDGPIEVAQDFSEYHL